MLSDISVGLGQQDSLIVSTGIFNQGKVVLGQNLVRDNARLVAAVDVVVQGNIDFLKLSDQVSVMLKSIMIQVVTIFNQWLVPLQLVL